MVRARRHRGGGVVGRDRRGCGRRRLRGSGPRRRRRRLRRPGRRRPAGCDPPPPRGPPERGEADRADRDVRRPGAESESSKREVFRRADASPPRRFFAGALRVAARLRETRALHVLVASDSPPSVVAKVLEDHAGIALVVRRAPQIDGAARLVAARTKRLENGDLDVAFLGGGNPRRAASLAASLASLEASLGRVAESPRPRARASARRPADRRRLVALHCVASADLVLAPDSDHEKGSGRSSYFLDFARLLSKGVFEGVPSKGARYDAAAVNARGDALLEKLPSSDGA